MYQFSRYQLIFQGKLKGIILCVIVLFLANHIVVGQLTVTPTPTSEIIGYGDTLAITSLVISENGDSTALGKSPSFISSWDTLTLTATGGFMFAANSDPTATTVGDDISDGPTLIEALTDNYTRVFAFYVAKTLNENTITISGIKLVANAVNTSPSGGIHVKLDTAGSSGPQIDRTVGTYSMEQPIFNLNYDTEPCDNQQFTLGVELVDTKSSFTDNDTLFVEYLRDLGDYTDAIIDTILLGTTRSHTIIYDSLYSDYNALRVRAKYENNWEIIDTINISNTAGPNIEMHRSVSPNFDFIGDAAGVPFIGVSLLISRYNISDLISYDDANDILHIATSSYLIKDNGEYFFLPPIAGSGIHEIDITVTKTTVGGHECSLTKILRINVLPDIISVKDVYCYGYNFQDTIDVALNVLENAYSVKNVTSSNSTTQSITTLEFSSLTIEYAGETMRDFSADSAVSHDVTSIKFAFNPSRLIEDALEEVPTTGEDIDITCKLNVLEHTETTTNLWVDWVVNAAVTDFIEEGWTCHPTTSTGESTCSLTVATVKEAIINIQSETTTIFTPRNDGYLQDFSFLYCQNSDPIRLRSNRTIDTIKSVFEEGIMYDPINEEYFIDPAAFRSDTNTIFELKLDYYDANTCSNDTTLQTTIYAVPEVEFLAEEICEDSAQVFLQQSPDSGWVNIKGYSWDFGDGFSISNFADTSAVNLHVGTHGGRTSGTYNNPSHRYLEPGKKEITLRIMSEQGCINASTDTIVIGKYPTPALTYFGKLQNETTTLENLSGVFEDDPVEQFTYSLTTPSGLPLPFVRTTYDPVTFEPEEHGVYKINMQARTQNGCIRSVDTLLPVFPIEPVYDDILYSEDFTGGEGTTGWLPSYSFVREQDTGWKYVPVAGVFNDADKHQDGSMWLTGDYHDSVDNEKGWLESPCFDIQDLSFPRLSMDIYQSIEPGRDGAIIQYSVDDGLSWTRLGSTTSGVNWYNNIGIFSNPGGNSGENEGSQGWSKDTNAWVTVYHPLDSVKAASGGNCVRFRIAYNSNNFHDSKYAGLAIDNFTVARRKRIVLLEEFINSSYVGKTPSDGQTDYEGLNSFLGGLPDEVCDIRYHIKNSHYIDDLYDINIWDNSARASEYGALNYGPLWVMDGIIRSKYRNVFYDVSYMKAFEERALAEPAFEIKDVQRQLDGNALNISATIKKTSMHMEEKIGPHVSIVRMAIVQKLYTDENNTTHKNVLIDLLPNGVGNVVERIPENFPQGDEVTVSATWNPNVKTVGNEFRLIIYVQAPWGDDEVEQVWFQDLDISETPQITTGIKDASISENELIIYPNPVTDDLTIELPIDFKEDVVWKIYTLNGQMIKQDEFYRADNKKTISVKELPEGFYVLQLRNGKGKQLNQKFSKK